MPTDDPVTTSGLLLKEYDRIKEEQRARIGFRDNLLYATLASMAVIIAAALRDEDRVDLLLLLPPVSVLLGWTYLVNDEKISAIGRYVREELGPCLGDLAGEPPGTRVFGWEEAHRRDHRRETRKRLQLAVDLLTFCAAPIAAVVVFWSTGDVGGALLLVSLGEVAAVAVLAWQIVSYADVV